MNITDITRRAGSGPSRKRVGRGRGSGHGKTAGRGHKGAGARSGHRKQSLAEGGGFPLFRRIPKYGFSNARFRTVYQVVNVADLARRFEEGGHVSTASLEEVGLIRDRKNLVKVLGNGELAKKLTVEAHRFSRTAVSKIEGAGGAVKWLAPKPKKKFVKRPKGQRQAASERGDAKSPKGAASKPDKSAEKGKKSKRAGEAGREGKAEKGPDA